jgi:uncharacterized protein (TIGR00297 family)
MAPILRIIVAVALSVLLSLHGYSKKSLDLSGAVAAFFVGVISLGSSYRFGILLLLFYYSSSKLTKLKEDIKAKLEDEYLAGGQRSFVQVFASSLFAVIVCALYVIYCGEDRNIDFSDPSVMLSNQFACLIVAHYACANGDTWASELGILAPSRPRLVTSLFLREVPPGTNGGMSVRGTMASLFGGLFIGLAYSLLAFFYLPRSDRSHMEQLAMMIVFGGLSGVVGSLLDSLLGATLQASYYSREKKKIVKRMDAADRSVERICGTDVLSNETVNFLSIGLTMVLSWLLAPRLFALVA